MALAANPRSALLTGVNPFLKIGLSFGLIALALALKDLSAMGVLVAGLLLLLAQLPMRPLIWLYCLVSLGIFVVTSAWLLGSWSEAALAGLRLLAIFLPGPVLALSTPPTDLLRSLQKAPLPGFLALSLMPLWRFFPLMLQELERIWEANRLRGIDLRRRPGQWFSGLLVPLVFQMVVYADEVTVGLQTRGYDPDAPRSCSRPVGWRPLDSLFCLIIGVWIGSVIYLEWFT
ncbi:energy-coupling factor transporter transmembrane protein EcfT [filamentous cyanobacterium CCP5]|nr:energy-coupling factor transporter transmembrane protein EcfT [filamentous cyanobacterium CCP5]